MQLREENRKNLEKFRPADENFEVWMWQDALDDSNKPCDFSVQPRVTKLRGLLFLPIASLCPIHLDLQHLRSICCEESGSLVSLEGVANVTGCTGND